MPSVEHDTFLSTILQASEEVRDQQLSIAEQRAGYEAVASAYPVADDVVVEPVEASGIPAEWLSSPGADADRVVLYLHGGGYTTGSLATHRDVASRVGRASSTRVLSIAYRLAPEHPYPAALDDAVAAYEWLLAGGQEAKRVALAGDSAGGGLAATVLLALRDRGLPMPGAAALIAPWTDLAPSADTLARRLSRDALMSTDKWGEASGHYVGDADPYDPLISPLYGKLHDLPPVMVQVGTADGLLEDGRAFVEKLQEAGGVAELDVYEGLIHEFQQLVPWAPETSTAMDRLGAFIARHTGRP